jgi:glycine cleavage system H protein
MAGDAIGSVESIKAVAELYTPVGGDVLEINEELLKWPGFFNEDPHGKGWMIKLRLTAPSDLGQLMRAEDYERYVRMGD